MNDTIDARRVGRAIAGMAAVALGVGALTSCGSDKPIVMPDVTGHKLDVALKEIKKAGVDDDPKVDGGGVFGVVMESNWTVCEQVPDASAKVTKTPKLTVARQCESDKKDAASASPTTSPSASSMPIEDITVDALLDRLNSTDDAVLAKGGHFRVKGELFEQDAWSAGRAGYGVFLKAKGGKDDLMVLANEDDAHEWKNGTKVEMVLELVERTVDGDTSHGWLEVESARVLTGGTTAKAKASAKRGNILKAMRDYAANVNATIRTTVIDGIDKGYADGVFHVALSPSLAQLPVAQIKSLIQQWNSDLMDAVEAADGSAVSIKYYMGGGEVAKNHSIMDPWSVDFSGILDD